MTEIYAITDIGQQREHNEDCFLVNDYIAASGDKHIVVEGDFIITVADGVGGYNAGEVASRIALEQLALKYDDIVKGPSSPTKNDLSGFSKDILADTIIEAHQNIRTYGNKCPEANGLCATVAGILCVENKITVFHVGDSRVYRFRDGILKCLTKDQSLVQVLYDSGRITREEMFDHPQKNIILQSVGGQNKSVDADIQCLRSGFEAGDIFLVCTDGLTDMIRDEVIEEILATKDINTVAKTLIAKANESGGYDNITVIVVRNNQDRTETCSPPAKV